MEALIAQYTSANEDSRLTRQYITQMEFDTTMHTLQGLITSGTKVCELGAATGRYSLTFAKQGCEVTAVELVPEQVEILKQNAESQSLTLNVYQGNACDVPFIASESQDLCVVLGPLYHLQSSNEREQAIREAKRILKPGGTLAVAYISRYFVAGMFAQKFPELMTPDVLSELRTQGTVSSPKADSFFNVGYFSTPEEMENLLTDQEMEISHHVATDGIGRYISDGVNQFTPSQYQTWLNYHLATCAEPSVLGSSNHGLVLAIK